MGARSGEARARAAGLAGLRPGKPPPRGLRRLVGAGRLKAARLLERISEPVFQYSGTYVDAYPNRFAKALRRAVAEGRLADYAPAFAGWAARLTGPNWPKDMGLFIQGVSSPGLATLLRDAVAAGVSDGASGSLAVDACLGAAARLPLAARAAQLHQLEAEHPEMLAASPLVAALAMLPQVPGAPPATPSKSRAAVADAARSRLFCVLAPDVSLWDVAAVVPPKSELVVCAYRPAKSATESWLLQSKDPDLGISVTVIDTLQDEADLNDAAHRAMSRAADRIARDALADPAWAIGRDMNGFWMRHAESAELMLSDRLFAWFRIHSAFAAVARELDISGACLIGLAGEAVPMVRATLARLHPGLPVLEAQTGTSLSILARAASRTDPAWPARNYLDPANLAGVIDSARRHAGEAAGRLETRSRGVALSAGGRLYGPAAVAVAQALKGDATSIDDLLASATSARIRLRVDVGEEAVGRWTPARLRAKLIRRLGIDARALNIRIGAVVATFLATDLPSLLLVDAASSAVIDVLKPDYGVVLPTRSPRLRVVARNLQAAGAVVHEAQVVYLSRMPRYRAPVADQFHALDTYSAGQMVKVFKVPPSTVRIGGSLRASGGGVTRTPSERPGPFRIMLASQPEPLALALDRLTAVLGALAHFDADWVLCVRPHPAESELRIAAYRGVLAESGVVAEFDRPLEDADLLISGFSNLVLEAAVSGIRSVVYWPSSAAPPVPYARMGLALQARSVADLAGFIAECHADGLRALRLDRTRSAYLRLNPLSSGGAADAMARSIRERSLDHRP